MVKKSRQPVKKSTRGMGDYTREGTERKEKERKSEKEETRREVILLSEEMHFVCSIPVVVFDVAANCGERRRNKEGKTDL